MVKRKLKQRTGDLTVIVNVGGVPTKKVRKKRGKSRARGGGSVRPAKNFVVSYTDQTPTLNLLKEFSETNRLLLTGQNNLAPALAAAPAAPARLAAQTSEPSVMGTAYSIDTTRPIDTPRPNRLAPEPLAPDPPRPPRPLPSRPLVPKPPRGQAAKSQDLSGFRKLASHFRGRVKPEIMEDTKQDLDREKMRQEDKASRKMPPPRPERLTGNVEAISTMKANLAEVERRFAQPGPPALAPLESPQVSSPLVDALLSSIPTTPLTRQFSDIEPTPPVSRQTSDTRPPMVTRGEETLPQRPPPNMSSQFTNTELPPNRSSQFTNTELPPNMSTGTNTDPPSEEAVRLARDQAAVIGRTKAELKKTKAELAKSKPSMTTAGIQTLPLQVSPPNTSTGTNTEPPRPPNRSSQFTNTELPPNMSTGTNTEPPRPPPNTSSQFTNTELPPNRSSQFTNTELPPNMSTGTNTDPPSEEAVRLARDQAAVIGRTKAELKKTKAELAKSKPSMTTAGVQTLPLQVSPPNTSTGTNTEPPPNRSSQFTNTESPPNTSTGTNTLPPRPPPNMSTQFTNTESPPNMSTGTNTLPPRPPPNMSTQFTNTDPPPNRTESGTSTPIAQMTTTGTDALPQRPPRNMSTQFTNTDPPPNMSTGTNTEPEDNLRKAMDELAQPKVKEKFKEKKVRITQERKDRDTEQLKEREEKTSDYGGPARMLSIRQKIVAQDSAKKVVAPSQNVEGSFPQKVVAQNVAGSFLSSVSRNFQQRLAPTKRMDSGAEQRPTIEQTLLSLRAESKPLPINDRWNRPSLDDVSADIARKKPSAPKRSVSMVVPSVVVPSVAAPSVVAPPKPLKGVPKPKRRTPKVDQPGTDI